MDFNTILQRWIHGEWGIPALKAAYRAGIITKDEYRKIKDAPKVEKAPTEQKA